eukprot:2467738-Lingulodinium_polyedra.AAC.1
MVKTPGGWEARGPTLRWGRAVRLESTVARPDAAPLWYAVWLFPPFVHPAFRRGGARPTG